MRWQTRLAFLWLCTGLLWCFVGCTELPPPTPPATPGTTTGTTAPGTTGSSGTPSGSTRTSTTTTPTSGLDGESVAGATRDSIQQNWGVTVSDGTGASVPPYSIAAGAWSSSEVSMLNTLLGSLPESFRRSTRTLIKTNVISPQPVHGIIGGLYDPNTKKIYMSAQSSDLRGSTVHEMAHAWHYANPADMAAWQSQFWVPGNPGYPKRASVTEYGDSTPAEDLCESVKYYVTRASTLRSSDPERYNFIKTRIMGGKEF